ncbi:phosphohistidine phosphatase SixA [Sansalvadorimonas verongulae]|uniref:phosphohistidine phosphatase SixA n=1 Tax=Sansalvadorimonas verongulae TaxID=2172824 RepID=UPI0012BB4A60|nr:phosphohistidine phosphatase SixA [Sansalvadorimonas verongulae]MTI13107.1 phosphohistidine phosphatase SixA [Sansalvadorimonas verongulae]
MKLYVMRHGDAVLNAPSDELRPLTAFGQDQARRVAEQLQGIDFTGILASPYQRAQQTAEIIRTLVSGPDITTVDTVIPDASPSRAINQLPEEGNWLLVAHMPLVGRLTGLLVDGVEAAGIGFSTAMVAELEMDFPGQGMATLKTILTP